MDAEQEEWEAQVIAQMLQCGLLQPDTQATSVFDMLDQGFTNLIHSGPTASSVEDRVNVAQDDDDPLKWTVYVPEASMYDDRLPLSCVFEVAEKVGGVALCELVAYVLNKYGGITGPWRWESLDYEGGGQHPDDSSDWVDGDSTATSEAELWRDKLYADRPYLTADLMPSASARLSDLPAPLCAILTRMHDYPSRPSGVDGKAVRYLTCWQQGDMIEHCWDWIRYCMENGIYESTDGPTFEVAGEISTITARLGAAEEWAQPARQLREWIAMQNNKDHNANA
jgi:hypothetical protein